MNAHRVFSSVAAVALCAVPSLAQAPVVASPVANPSATVRASHARFTVLTPELIRMEWAEDNQFEDHPSLIFLNRKLPVPAFSARQKNGTLTIDTGKLHLVYQVAAKATGFTAENLEVSLTLDGKSVIWRPGHPRPAILKEQLAPLMARRVPSI